MNINWEKIEKVFRLFFPEFSNKVTWCVVVAGIGLTSTSFVQSIINAVLETQFNIKILGQYDSLVGIVLIAFGLIHNILLQREKTKIEVNGKSEVNKQAIEHDKTLFEHLNSILDDEYLMDFFEGVEVNHAYFYSKVKPLTDFMYEIEKVKTEFVLDSIASSLNQLKPVTRQLNEFFVCNFDPYGPGRGDDLWLCLHPHWNCDRAGSWSDFEGSKKYDAAMKGLFQLIDNYKESYKDYRLAVKKELCI
ncbi:hypothetical protein [Photobacterium kishitanii]|uniref:Uncharacterized protein n=1 Tax=Photobacterium kishitanii TaxID=318456 RepID=A0A2T3KJ43_9GAMM|nr:hypothetical protein [Photobacterium kishitanii]PSU99289.1 hypothetical protein C9J27_10025 [Photobacterium kishitanii]